MDLLIWKSEGSGDGDSGGAEGAVWTCTVTAPNGPSCPVSVPQVHLETFVSLVTGWRWSWSHSIQN